MMLIIYSVRLLMKTRSFSTSWATGDMFMCMLMSGVAVVVALAYARCWSISIYEPASSVCFPSWPCRSDPEDWRDSYCEL